MTARREPVRPFFAGVVIEGAGETALADAQSLVAGRLVRHVAVNIERTPDPHRRAALNSLVRELTEAV